MKARVNVLTTLLILIVAVSAMSAGRYDQLKPNQVIGQFKTECVYLNADNIAIGARFRHIPSGFVLDLFSIQSLPQAFFWVNSLPPSDRGEPHTCEHLVLGKGTKGRYVSSLGNMLLSENSAFTDQLRTCYHINTEAGADAFFTMFENSLDALIHPNYTDEDIRREVCNMGVAVDQSDSSLRLEEKGTIYNEMVSSYESPWGEMLYRLGKVMYGANHPLSNDAGGFPDSIRTMTPENLRSFHDAAYHLNNMGVVVSIPSDITVDSCLNSLSRILGKIEPDAKPGDPASLESRILSPQMGEFGQILVTHFPSQDANQPGQLTVAWPPTLKFDMREQYLMELLASNLASDQTSMLYKTLVDSRSRKLETGATWVSSTVSSDPGHSLFLYLYGIKSAYLAPLGIDSVRKVILSEIGRVGSMAPGSQELNEFNVMAQSRMTERRRNLKVFLNTPPGFGFRGTGTGWLSAVDRAAKEGGFKRSLMFDAEFALVDSLLTTGQNFWREYIDKWQLATTKPYVSAAAPDTALLTQKERDRQERIGAFTENLKKTYAVATDAEAIRLFKRDYDLKTNQIEQEAKSIPMPRFVDKPPLTLDDQIRFATEKLPGGGDVVVSTFDNITGATVGLAFNLNVVPESMLVYVPALPAMLTSIGVITGKDTIAYDVMRLRIRREILGLYAYFSANPRTDRAELAVGATGSDRIETGKALSWLGMALFDQNLTVSNLARIRDAVDEELASTRNRMRGSEESWVETPAEAYWKQRNHLFLSTNCFLTQQYSLLRLKWMLREASNDSVATEFVSFLEDLAKVSANTTRQQLADLTRGLARLKNPAISATPDQEFSLRFIGLKQETKDALADALEDIEGALAGIPDGSLESDWAQLCRQMAADYRTPAKQALAQIKNVLELVLSRNNVRGFVTTNGREQNEVLASLDKIVNRLNQRVPVRQKYDKSPLVADRLKQRLPDAVHPLYVGLINNNTRAGVFVNSANGACYQDSSSDVLLNYLADRLYGGHGAHSMFMKTWGAGLAYSNGLRASVFEGRIGYYAERCPDLAQTMQFVINELKNAPHDPSLADYAVAVAFSGTRGGRTYDSRGEAMANDLADGVTPEVVKRFRQKLLALRGGDMFYDQIQTRMPIVYGQILPGYGVKAQDAVDKADANYFVIGPEAQMQSYEKYLRSADSSATLYRLYPRDFWLTGSGK